MSGVHHQDDLFRRPTRPFRFDPNPAGGQSLAASGSRDWRPIVHVLVPRLHAALDGRGWVACKVLARELDADDRSIREAAHHSRGEIIGGQKGYCLTRQATIEDVQQITRWLLSQAGEMRSRVVEIERVRHGSGRDLGGAS